MPTITARTTVITLFQGDDFDRELELRRAIENAASTVENPKRMGDSPSVQSAARAYDEFVAEAADRGVKVTLCSIKRSLFRELVSKHPAREGNDADVAWGFNYESLADDLVPASVLLDEQFSSPRDRDDFLDSLSDADFSTLYSAAVRLNQAQGPDPKASASSRLGLTGGETSAPPTRLG